LRDIKKSNVHVLEAPEKEENDWGNRLFFFPPCKYIYKTSGIKIFNTPSDSIFNVYRYDTDENCILMRGQ
jgi:hypothetical protein